MISSRWRTVLACGILAFCLPTNTEAHTFDEGSLIIPMDLDYQDYGMFKAFGLLYQLLLEDVPVHWVIDSEKSFTLTENNDFFYDPDFTTSAVDVDSGATITEHGYRAGPFLIDSEDAAAAFPIIEAWQDTYTTTVGETTFPTVTVHRVTTAFDGEISRTLTVAPTIAVFADRNQKVAFDYLNEAGIPSCEPVADGELECRCWPEDKADCTGFAESGDEDEYTTILEFEDIAGDSPEIHNEGALFDAHGRPLWCQLMTMHWDEGDRDEAAIAEVHQFLQFPTHFMAECQAVNAIENAENGGFLTRHGFGPRQDEPDWQSIEIVNSYLPFAQFDGPYGREGGSEPSFSPLYQDEDGDWVTGAEGYIDEGVIMLTASGSDAGVHDVWMTGYVDGACAIADKGDECGLGIGKVSYLGGHNYYNEGDDDAVTPVSSHGNTQGMRLFLNSLFEADCVTTIGQAQMVVTASAPAVTNQPGFEVTLLIENRGPGTVYESVLTALLPAGLGFESASPEPTTRDGANLSWDLGNFSSTDQVVVSIDVTADAPGTYANSARLDFRMSLNPRSSVSRVVETLYDPEADVGDDDSGDDSAEDSAEGGADMGPDVTLDAAPDDASDQETDGEGDSTSGSDLPEGSDLSFDGTTPGSEPTRSGGSSSAPQSGCDCTTVDPRRADLWLVSIAGLAIVAARRRRRDRSG